ncbi:MAG: creatininase family protein [Candidatus Pelethousia sp.]|nr:creatininase family protein [Candidatus Pelethousia sp.]
MKLQEATWLQVKAYFEENDTVVIGTGSVENHGKHLPLGTDALIPQKLISLIEGKTHVLCTPVMPFGSCDYFTQFPGTISLGDEVLRQVLLKIAQGLYTAGARKFVYVNGHGGNCAAIESVCYAMSKQGAVSAVVNWWSMAAGELNPQWAGGHGGGEETAAIMYVNPDLVDKNQMHPKNLARVSENIESVSLKLGRFKGINVTIPRDVGDVSSNGWYGSDDIKDATPEWGEEMLTTVANYITEFIEEFKTAKLGRSSEYHL